MLVMFYFVYFLPKITFVRSTFNIVFLRTATIICYLFNDLVTTKAGDKFSRRSNGEVPLEIDPPAISALFDQVQS